MSQELLQGQDPDQYQGRDLDQDQFQSHLLDLHLQLSPVRGPEADLLEPFSLTKVL